MELQQLENNQPDHGRVLHILVNLNPCLAEDETLLLSYYKRVRATWSPSAIKTLQGITGLKLTTKLNRCQFAIAAAKQELQWEQPEVEGDSSYLEREQLPFTNYQIIEELPTLTNFQAEVFDPFDKNVAEPESDKNRPLSLSSSDNLIIEPEPSEATNESNQEQLLKAIEQIKFLSSQLKEKQEQLELQQEQLEQKQQQLEQSENFSVLLLTNRLLPPGLPLNGTEESPAMRILGSPKTLTELKANYRELIKREHPDVSPFSSTEAINRFAYVRSLYRITREHWQKLKPTATITTAELQKRMIAPVPFSPESFWAA